MERRAPIDGLRRLLRARLLCGAAAGLFILCPPPAASGAAEESARAGARPAEAGQLHACGVMPMALSFIGDAYAYPVPYVPSQGHREIVFTNLGADTLVRIYTVSGALVRELHETEGDGQAVWDAKNEAGEDAVSGVYIYVITSGSEKKEGKLVIVR